jgi:hypothetical protein
MASSILNSDDGVISGTSGLKSTGGDDGVLVFQSKGTETARINTDKQIVAAAGTASLPIYSTTGDLNTGIFFPAADTIAFAEGGAEAMRIDSSGNVGIGLTPSAWDSTVRPVLSVKASTGSFSFGASGVDNARFLSNAYFSGGFKRVAAGYASQYEQNAGTHIWYTADTSTADSAVTFAERMRIDSSGNLLVGTTSAVDAEKFNVTSAVASKFTSRIYNTSATPLGVAVLYTGASPNGTENAFLYCQDSTTLRMELRSNGGIANYSGNDVNLSDAREKTNVELAGSYINKICAIPVKTFNYIDQNRETDDGLTLGVIAQDVETVAPELVMESNWGTKDDPKMRLSIYQTDLQYALMKCIQELKAELDTVKAELATLKGN